MAILAVIDALAVSGMAAAHQFSADLVSTDAAGRQQQIARLYAADGKVRIETHDAAHSFFLVDHSDAAYLVRPASKIYMDAKQSSPLTQIFVPLDAEAPCRAWEKAAVTAGSADGARPWSCVRAAPEASDGRMTIKYRTTSPSGRESWRWVDPHLGFTVKVASEGGGTLELRRIEEGPQRAELFQVPAGYRKFDPRQLIERIKQSDVWVAPPE